MRTTIPTALAYRNTLAGAVMHMLESHERGPLWEEEVRAWLREIQAVKEKAND